MYAVGKMTCGHFLLLINTHGSIYVDFLVIQIDTCKCTYLESFFFVLVLKVKQTKRYLQLKFCLKLYKV